MNREFKPVKVGQTVWVKDQPLRSSIGANIVQTVVAKVGRKYFEVEAFKRTKFYTQTGILVSDFTRDIYVYHSKEEIEQELRANELSSKITEAFRYYGKSPYNLDQLEAIAKIIEIGEQ